MSAVENSGVVGVSARYAAQIKQLLRAQAAKRLAAQKEAVRQAEADQKAQEQRIREATATSKTPQTEKVEPVADTRETPTTPINSAQPSGPVAEKTTGTHVNKRI